MRAGGAAAAGMLAALALGPTVTPAAAQGMRFSLVAAQVAFDAGAAIELRWTLTNDSTQSWQVLAGAPDCDAITVHIAGPEQGFPRSLQLSLPRSAYRPEIAVLAPGQSLTRSLDLRAFGAVFRLGFPPGDYSVSGSYQMTGAVGVPTPSATPSWSGTAAAPPIRFTVRATR